MIINSRLIDFKRELRELISFNEASVIEFELLFSALLDVNYLNNTSSILAWLKEINQKQYFHVEEIPFNKLNQWFFDANTGDLKHNSGKFFSIRGLQVFNNQTDEILWDQPVIDQPEIGVLGLLCKPISGVLHFLMQAKAEPGNLNTYQLSPTVQATRSNYLQVHGGKRTKYIEYFDGSANVEVLFDQYQSEQGARFTGKRNRNLIVLVDKKHEVSSDENFKWLTLGQIKALMEHDNTVNMDSRSIISQIQYSGLNLSANREELITLIDNYRDISKRSRLWIEAIADLISTKIDDENLVSTQNKLTCERYFCPKQSRLIALNDVKDWNVKNTIIEHKANKYFQVLAVKISADNREVVHWDQPIIKQRSEGIVGILVSKVNEKIHILIHLKYEPGLYDSIEIAPTVQCIVNNYNISELPPYVDYFKEDAGSYIYNSRQSEEGGRFYQECSANIIREVKQNDITLYPGYMWISVSNLKKIVKFQQNINVELRRLLAYF